MRDAIRNTGRVGERERDMRRCNEKDRNSERDIIRREKN
jgi:hypothetical protein